MVRVGAVAALVIVLALPAAAWAHGERQIEDPKEGAKLKEPPAAITMTLTESPAQGSVLKATDGCGRKVLGEVSVDGSDLVLSVSGGEPGNWNVAFRAISAEDGHLTKGRYSFSVAGPKDCSQPQTPGDEIAGGAGTRVDSDENSGSSFPIVPFAVGTVVVVAAAFLLRRASS